MQCQDPPDPFAEMLAGERCTGNILDAFVQFKCGAIAFAIELAAPSFVADLPTMRHSVIENLDSGDCPVGFSVTA